MQFIQIQDIARTDLQNKNTKNSFNVQKKRLRGHLTGNCSNFPTSHEGIFVNDRLGGFSGSLRKGAASAVALKTHKKHAVGVESAS